MRVTVVSLYANPIHCGHLDYIEAAVKMGNYVIAIVNNDHQVKLKGSQPFMSQEERLRIVGSIKGVDKAVLSIDKDVTVCQSVRAEYYKLQDDVFFERMTFANGETEKKAVFPKMY